MPFDGGGRHDRAHHLENSAKAVTTAHSTTANREIGNFREILVDEVLWLMREQGKSERAAMLTVLGKAWAGELRPELLATVTQARDKRGRKSQKPNPNGIPGLGALSRMLKKRREGKSQVPAESSQRDMTLQPWHAIVWELWRRPQKPAYTQVHAAVVERWQLEWAPAPPGYDAVRRFIIDKCSHGDMADGRNTGSALRSYKSYQPRTAAGLFPFQFVCGDGWNTHFRAPHPVSGELVTYEIWHFHDVATRFVPPVSIGLTESSRVILKGIENCIRVGGRVRELLTDHTRSIKNDKIEFDPVASVSVRAGFTLKHPNTVGNSQANGIAEKFNQYMDGESRELATYQNPKVMDESAWKKVGKISAKTMKAYKAGQLTEAGQLKAQAEKHGKGLQFTSYAEAVAWINAKVDKYNRRPCEANPKEVNSETGRDEHLSPLAMLQRFREGGWQPLAVDEPTLIDLFREHKRKRVTRGMVSPFNGQLYKHEDLWHYTKTDSQRGQEVLVVIDPMDWERVGVKTLDGAWICEATFVAATGYSTLTAQEHADQRLMNAQIKHKENGIEHIRARMAPATLEMPSAQVLVEELTQARAKKATETAEAVDADLLDVCPALPAVTPLPVRQRSLIETFEWLQEAEAKRDAAAAG